MNPMVVTILLWMALPIPMLIGIPLIRRAMQDACDVCGAMFDPSTAMPCHTDDGSVWQYRWTSEEAMLKAHFPDGRIDDCGDLSCGECRVCDEYEAYMERAAQNARDEQCGEQPCESYCNHWGCQALDKR